MTDESKNSIEKVLHDIKELLNNENKTVELHSLFDAMIGRKIYNHHECIYDDSIIIESESLCLIGDINIYMKKPSCCQSRKKE